MGNMKTVNAYGREFTVPKEARYIAVDAPKFNNDGHRVCRIFAYESEPFYSSCLSDASATVWMTTAQYWELDTIRAYDVGDWRRSLIALPNSSIGADDDEKARIYRADYIASLLRNRERATRKIEEYTKFIAAQTDDVVLEFINGGGETLRFVESVELRDRFLPVLAALRDEAIAERDEIDNKILLMSNAIGIK